MEYQKYGAMTLIISLGIPNALMTIMGHVDWFVQRDVDINSYKGEEALSPVNGTLRSYNDDKGKLLGVHISLTRNEYPLGTRRIKVCGNRKSEV